VRGAASNGRPYRETIAVGMISATRPKVRLGPIATGPADSSSSHVCGAPKAEVSRALRLLDALDAQQNFEPSRLAEACD
jgi:hypothetical protein